MTARKSAQVRGVELLAPHLRRPYRVRITLNAGMHAAHLYRRPEQIVGLVVGFARRIDGATGKALDVVVQTDDSSLMTTFVVSRVIAVEVVP